MFTEAFTGFTICFVVCGVDDVHFESRCENNAVELVVFTICPYAGFVDALNALSVCVDEVC